MATLRRGLVDTVKKAAAQVSTRGAQVAAKAGTRGARALVETTVAAVRTVDRLQEKLGRRPGKANAVQARETGGVAAEPVARQPTPRATRPVTAKPTGAPAKRTPPAKPEAPPAKPRRAAAESTSEARPVALREGGRKTTPAAAPKRSKQAQASRKQFKVKRGQKHLHSGR